MSHRLTDDRGALFGLLISCCAHFHGCIKDPPLNGLQSVPDIRERSGDDDGHRIVDVGTLHRVLQIDILYFIVYIGFHLYSPHAWCSVTGLYVEIGNVFRIFFNKDPSRFDLVAHKCGKGQIQLRAGIFVHIDAEQSPCLRIHGRLREFLIFHLT